MDVDEVTPILAFKFKPPVSGMAKTSLLRKGVSRIPRFKKMSSISSSSVLHNFVYNARMQQDASLGVKSLDFFDVSLLSKRQRKEARKLLNQAIACGEDDDNDYQQKYVDEFIGFKEARSTSWNSTMSDAHPDGNILGKHPLLYDCTVRGTKLKAFLDLGAVNLPVPVGPRASNRTPVYMSTAAADKCGIKLTRSSEPTVIECANESTMESAYHALDVELRFGPHRERVDVHVLPVDTFDIVLGLQWFLSRGPEINHSDGSLVIPTLSSKQQQPSDSIIKPYKKVRVPLTHANSRIFRRGRYLSAFSKRAGTRKQQTQTSDYVPDSDENEVYHDVKQFLKANKRSLECAIEPQPLYMLRFHDDKPIVKKHLLGEEVEVVNPYSKQAAEFDPSDDTVFTTGAQFNAFKTYREQGLANKNVLHDFKTIENTIPPDVERPPKPGFEQKIWDLFNAGDDTLFPLEVPKGKGVKIPSIIELMPDKENETPCRQPIPLSPDHQEELYAQIKYYLDKGWIVPSDSPYGAPVFFVPKRNGKLRMVIDYRALNAITRKDKFSLPNADDLLAQLGGAKHYSSIDMAHGYHQCILPEEDRPKTAFRTLFGSYQWTVMTFGFTNAVPAFIKLMERILRPYIGKCCVCFIDDVIVYTKGDEQQHFTDVCNVLQCIKDAGMYVNWVKSEFLASNVEYLGHYISPEGVKPIEDKVKAVQDWVRPTTVYHVRSFLGAVGYYRKHIFRFAEIASPLYELTKDDKSRKATTATNITMAKFGRKVQTTSIEDEWTDAHEQAFLKLKAALTSAPVLRLPDPNLDYEIMVDSSTKAIGSVLMQRHDGKLHPVAFYSCKLTGAELSYPPYEFEMLAIYKSLKQWRHLVIASKCLIYTDHKPLTHLLTQVNLLTQRQQRWITFLADFDIDICSVEGAKNFVTDALSRLPTDTAQALTDVSDRLKAKAVSMLASGTLYHRLMGDGTRAKFASNLSKSIDVYGFDPECALDEIVVSCMWAVTASQPGISVQPNDVSVSILEAYADDNLSQAVLNELPGVHERYGVYDGVVVHSDRNDKLTIYVPPNAKATPKNQVTEHPMPGDDIRISCTLREELIREAHDQCGHLGAGKTYDHLAKQFYWPKMRIHVLDYVRGCKACQRNKAATSKPYGKLRPLQIPTSRWEFVSMDWIINLPKSRSGYDAILVVLDSYSKRAHFIPTKTTATAANSAQLFFEYVYKHHGMPQKIVTDRDSKVTSDFWRVLFNLLGTNLAMSTPYHPQTDGATERCNRVIGDMLRWYTENGAKDWETFLPAAEFAYNNTIHAATGYTPFMLDTGRNPHDPISLASLSLLEQVEQQAPSEYGKSAEQYLNEWHDHLCLARAKLEESVDRYEEYYNRRYTPISFKVGDQVMLDTSDLKFIDQNTGLSKSRKKFDERYSGPYRIKRVIGNGSAYELDLGPTQQFHPVQSIVKLRPFRDSDIYKDSHNEVPPQSVFVERDGEEVEEYEVERVLAHRGPPDDRKYRVKWKGYTNAHNSWEPIANLLPGVAEIVSEYENSLRERRTDTLRRSSRFRSMLPFGS